MTRHGRWFRLPVLGALAGLTFAIGQPLAVAAPDQPASCTPDWVKGVFENKTEAALSVYALSSDWCDAPTNAIRPRGTDSWRAGSQEFGVPLALVSYRVEGGGIVTASARIRNGRTEADCRFEAPGGPAAYECRTEIQPSPDNKPDGKAVVRFVFQPVGR